MGIWKRKGAIIATCVLSLFATAIPSVAFAGDGDNGAGEGGGGGRGTVSNGSWVSFSYDKKGEAWKELLKYNETRDSNVKREVQKRVKNGGVQLCKNSKIIWVIGGKYNGKNIWVYNWNGKTDESAPAGRGSIRSPKKQVGKKITEQDWSNFINWEKSGAPGTGGYHKNPGYSIVCSGPFDTVPPKTGKYTKKLSPIVKKEGEQFTHPVAWNATVSPQPIKKSKNSGAPNNVSLDPIGKGGDLHSQNIASTTTNFGKLWKEVQKGKKYSPADLKKKVKQALDADKKAGRKGVDLDKKNIAGLTEGGVLNVTEFTQYATVSAQKTATTPRHQECTWEQTWNDKENKWNPRKDKCSKPIHGKTTYSTTTTSKNSTQKETGFWQVLSTHCNPDGVESLKKTKAANGKKFTIHKNVAKEKYSAVVYTPKYGKRPKHVDFGDSKNPNKTLAETGYLGFYDKECSFECVPNTKNEKGVIPSENARDNIRDHNKVKDGRYGVRTDDEKVNSNNLTFFRDNELRRIQPDIWYPKSNGGVSYKGDKAVTTTVSRWNGGTPRVRDNSGQGEFAMFQTSMKNGNPEAGTVVFDPKNKQKANQRNWSTETGQYDTYAVLPGEVNDFVVQSTWASTAGKPHVFTFKWEYQPNVSTTIPTRLGFAPNGAKPLAGNPKNTSTPIEGKCYAQFGQNTAPDYSKQFNKNTGTDTKNNLDGNVDYKGGNGGPEHLRVKFIRSTNE